MKNRLSTKLAYASGDIYGGGAFMVFSLLFMNYLVLVEGLSVVAATAIIFIGRVWDAFFDPVMGRISDRARSRFGRRRVFFLAGMLPVYVSFVMLFYGFGLQHDTDHTALVVYFTFSYIFWGMSFSLVMVPYNAILSDMTSDYNERTSFTTIRMLFSGGASLVCAVVPSMIIKGMGGDTIGPEQRSGYLVMALVLGAVFAIAWLLVFLGTYEREDVPPAAHVTLHDWVSVFSNRAYRNFLGIFLGFQVTVDLTLAIFIFYMDIVLLKYQYYELVVGLLLVCTVLFIPLMNMLAQRRGKAFPLFIGIPLWIAASLVFIGVDSATPLSLLCVLAVVIAAGSASGNLATWSMLTDIYDIDELLTAQRREGVYSGVTTFLRKFASGVAVLLVGLGLQVVHFDQNEYQVLRAQSQSLDPRAYADNLAVVGIKWMFIAIPLVLLSVCLAFALRTKVNQQRFDAVLAGIDELKTTGTLDGLTAQQLDDVLVVTGTTSGQLWGGEPVPPPASGRRPR
ncbi:MAG: MFS transporter [Nocardioides sp.]